MAEAEKKAQESVDETIGQKNSDSKFNVKIGSRMPNFRMTIGDAKKRSEFGDRTKDRTFVNKDGKNASLRLFGDKANLSSAENAHQKMTDTQSFYASLEEKHVTNRMDISTDEIVVNQHKLNPNLWEYADFRSFTDMYGELHCVGHFSAMGTVLAPSWDERLKKYVLIRRLCCMPLFSPSVNVPEILATLNVEDPTKEVNYYKIKQETETVDEWYSRIKNHGANGASVNNGKKTVVCFGDSLTSINSFPEHYSWTTTLQEKRPDLNIVNYGKHGGFTYNLMESDRKTLNMEAMKLAMLQYNPVGVLITLGGNDITSETDDTSVIFERYKTIVSYLMGQGIKVVAGTYDLTLTQCNKIVEGGNFPIKDGNEMKARFVSYSQKIRSWASANSCPVISIYSYIKDSNGEVPEDCLRPNDAVHLSQDAVKIVGAGIANTLSGWFDKL